MLFKEILFQKTPGLCGKKEKPIQINEWAFFSIL